MKLVNVALRRYRSIEEMKAFAVQSDVTCLVGKNESGKTAVLQSLFKSNSIDSTTFDEALDYPSNLTGERRRATSRIPVATLTYELDDDDVNAVERDLGEDSLDSPQITVVAGYKATESEWDVKVKEEAVVAYLRSGLDLPATPQNAVDATTTVSALLEILEGLEDPNSGAAAVVAKIRRWRSSSATSHAIDILEARRPKFVYFGEYDSMPGQVNIRELITLRDSNKMSRGQQAFLSLLHLANVEPEDFINPESEEHLIRDIENASNGITDEVFAYWSQNQNLRVQLRIAHTSTGSRTDPTIQIRVLNQKHNVTVPFDERSRGFVWFFSFLAFFSELEHVSNHPIILLLDEPGLSLHAKAQADLLRFIDERLAQHHQVIFTTHSPFMIDPQKFERVRTVQDEDKVGTQVSQDVLRADNDTVFPLMAAMGIDLTQTLWVGPNVLLVEGPADVVYLNFLSQQLEAEGRQSLDPRWIVTPGGSITKLPAFLSIFGANKMNVAVLTDSSSGDTAVVRRLKEVGRLGSGGLVQIGDVTGSQEADLEDLFTDDFYLDLVNDAYQGALGGKVLKTIDLPSGPRIVKRVGEYFKSEGINGGRLSHFAAASALLRKPSAFTSTLAAGTMDVAEDLFSRINAFLPQDTP